MDITEKIEKLLDFNKNGIMVGRLLVLPEIQEDKSSIYSKTDLDETKNKPTTSRVIAKSHCVNPDVEIGKVILHSRHIGATYEHNKNRYLVINSDEVMMIFK